MVNIDIPIEKELSFSKFDIMSERYPDNTAVLYLGEHFTYKRLKHLSECFTGGLKQLGIKNILTLFITINQIIFQYIFSCFLTQFIY